MTFKAFSPHKFLFIMTLTVSIKQCEKMNLFNQYTPKRQKHRFVSHSPYCPVVRLNGPRAYIRTPLYVPHTGRRFTVSYEMKTNVIWTYSASHFASVEGAQGYIVGFIFVFSRGNGKPQRPIRAKKDIYCFDTAEFIDRVCSLRGINKEESKVKVGLNCGKSFLKVSPKTMVDYYNNFKLHQFSPSGSTFKFFGAKRMLLHTPETHLTHQDIMHLAKINEILDYIFTGGLEMPTPMTGISSHESTHQYAYYISPSKSWDPPLRCSCQTHDLLCETV